MFIHLPLNWALLKLFRISSYDRHYHKVKVHYPSSYKSTAKKRAFASVGEPFGFINLGNLLTGYSVIVYVKPNADIRSKLLGVISTTGHKPPQHLVHSIHVKQPLEQTFFFK